MNCACGKPLHYTDTDIETIMTDLTKKLGEYVLVTVGKKTYRVQRHYIALHGLKAQDLPILKLFEIVRGGDKT